MTSSRRPIEIAGGDDRLEERRAVVLVELRHDEAGEHVGLVAEGSDQHRDLLDRADPDEDHRQRLGPPAELAQLGDRVPFGAVEIVIGDGVLEADDHGDDALGGPPDDVVGQSRPRGRAVQRGAHGDAQLFRVVVDAEVLRRAREQPVPVRVAEEGEMSHARMVAREHVKRLSGDLRDDLGAGPALSCHGTGGYATMAG